MLAFYAALLSPVHATWTLADRIRDRERLRLNCGVSVTKFDGDPILPRVVPSRDGTVYVRVVDVGRRPCTIERVGVAILVDGIECKFESFIVPRALAGPDGGPRTLNKCESLSVPVCRVGALPERLAIGTAAWDSTGRRRLASEKRFESVVRHWREARRGFRG